MAQWRYKCVAAPRKARRSRTHRDPADALLAAIDAAIAVEAAQGWEYLRTDLVPMEAKAGLFSAATETHLGVMVFRKPADGGDGEADPAPRQGPRLGAARGD
jgi:hypothetical protein